MCLPRILAKDCPQTRLSGDFEMKVWQDSMKQHREKECVANIGSTRKEYRQAFLSACGSPQHARVVLVGKVACRAVLVRKLQIAN